jgi:hypothetical protein
MPPYAAENFLTGAEVFETGRFKTCSNNNPLFMGSLPEFVAVNPITLGCPRCKAEAGHACETIDSDTEAVHLERIAAALTIDLANKKERDRISTKPSE